MNALNLQHDHVEMKKLRVEDLKNILALGGKSFIKSVPDSMISFIEKADHYHSIFVNGELHVCTGVNPYWNGRGEAWFIINPASKNKALFRVRNIIVDLLDDCPITRIECAVTRDEHFKVADKWARSLGFVMEHHRLRKFNPDGSDAAFYARIKEGA